jgi:cell division protein FtsW
MPPPVLRRLVEWFESVRGKLRARLARTSDTAAVPAMPLVASQQPSATLPERPYDLVLLAAVLGLLGLGTIEIYSATAAESLTHFGDAAHYLERQLGYVIVGGFAMWAGSRLDYRRLRDLTYPLLFGSLLLLAAALAMHPKNGAKRWIPLGPLTFQPVEIAKLALVTYLACSLGRKADQVKTFTIGFVPHLVVCGMMMVLLLKQPDLGSSVVLGATTLGMLFMAGARVSYISLAVLGAAPVAYHLVVGTPWRMQRFLAYFNPEAFGTKEGYQFLQARLAIGSGGLFGAGLGVVPNKGITLPLVSYGGSSLVITMFLVGLLLNVGRRPERKAAARALVQRQAIRKKRVRVRVVPA